MRQLNDYHCKFCNEVTERFCERLEEQHCEKCGEALSIIIQSHFKLDGTDPSFPTAADKWAKRHETLAR